MSAFRSASFQKRRLTGCCASIRSSMAKHLSASFGTVGNKTPAPARRGFPRAPKTHYPLDKLTHKYILSRQGVFTVFASGKCSYENGQESGAIPGRLFFQKIRWGHRPLMHSD